MSVGQIYNRIVFLLTGNATWKDQLTGDAYRTVESWNVRWAVAGIHSYQWWWVKRFGQLDCGCTRNPLTRRVVLFSSDCPRTGINLSSEGAS